MALSSWRENWCGDGSRSSGRRPETCSPCCQMHYQGYVVDSDPIRVLTGQEPRAKTMACFLKAHPQRGPASGFLTPDRTEMWTHCVRFIPFVQIIHSNLQTTCIPWSHLLRKVLMCIKLREYECLHGMEKIHFVKSPWVTSYRGSTQTSLRKKGIYFLSYWGNPVKHD